MTLPEVTHKKITRYVYKLQIPMPLLDNISYKEFGSPRCLVHVV